MDERPGVVLASGSPRRREMIAWLGYPVRVQPVSVDETPRPDEPPAAYVTRLAQAKARAAAPGVPPGWVAVGGDTAVVLDGRILGKPADAAEARAMLTALRDRSHQVLSAVAVFRPQDGQTWHAVVTSTVVMRPYSMAEMEAYIASGDPFDKAGGYAVQHPTFRPAARVGDCFANVVGLPLCHLAQGLARLLGPPDPTVPRRCMAAFGYNCAIYARIFPGEGWADEPNMAP